MALKRRSFSMEYKLKLLSEVDKAPKMNKTALAKILNIPTSTLATIMSKRKVIEESARKLGGRLSSRKKCMPSPFGDVEMVLLAWIKQCYATNIPINSWHIRDQALTIANKLGINHFTASNGWFDRFKNRYGIGHKMKKNSNGCNGEESMTSSEWRNEQLLPLIEGYDPKNIYNADEIGLFFNLLLEGSCYQNEYKDCNDREDRLTVLLCVNSDGSDKLPPLVIGKCRKPHGFEKFKTLPCKYVKNSNAWATTTIFEDYLSYIDRDMESAGRKILLFVDRCAAHPPDINLKNVKIVFFPSSCSNEVQPLSVGINNAFKQNYRKNFERNLEVMKSKYGPLSSKVDLLEALQFIVMSWDEVKIETIRSCFFKVGFPMVNFDSADNPAEESECDAKTIDPNNSIPTSGTQTLDELCDQLLLRDVDSDSDASVIPHSDVSLEESFKPEDCVEQSVSQVVEKEIAHLGNSEEVVQSPPPNFEAALNGFKNFKQYVCSFNIDDDMQNTLLLMEIALYKLHSRETLNNKLKRANEEES